MRFIKLTRGYWAMVDNEDYDRVKGWRWLTYPQGFMVYPARRIKTAEGKYKMHYLHYEVLGFPPVKGLVIDHINGNPMDCRRGNLRVCTSSQNNMNHRPRYNKVRSKYKGVTYRRIGKDKDQIVWDASICAGKKRHFLGAFSDELTAVKAYNVWARKLHGKFAYLNKWDGPTYESAKMDDMDAADGMDTNEHRPA